jgi:hypothetical protein
MRETVSLPRRIRRLPLQWIPMSDGVRLAATIWLPDDASVEPVPAILEYHPYRRDTTDPSRSLLVRVEGVDADGNETQLWCPLFDAWHAGHGYASIRVDIRGCGESEGILHDEYLPVEQTDAVEVFAWLAQQPWCDGACGMIGISWSGFNALQVAAHRPPELKAVVSFASTDDRYATDVHYMGGCVLAEYMLSWATDMLSRALRPPDPGVAGERWRERWIERIEETTPFIHTWLSHQRRDAYWQQGSVCEDYGRIVCPVYTIGGWHDAYSSPVLDLMAGLTAPRKGLIGPWGHMWPFAGIPGPSIPFLTECVRWWDHWLKGIDTGLLDEPELRMWLMDGVPPQTFYPERPGRWIAEPSWPSEATGSRELFLNEGTLDDGPGAETALQLLGVQRAGVDAGKSCGYGGTTDWPPDQREEDARSLAFTSAPLDEALDLVGFPVARLALAADRPLALVVVRLCDIAPDGASTLVTRGLLNLTHRDSHAEPTLLEPGERYDIALRLEATASRIAPGHRLRLSLSPTYWPWAWPSPEPVTLTVHTGSSTLELPVRPPRPEDATLRAFGPSELESIPPLAIERLAKREHTRTVTRDLETGLIVQRAEQNQKFGPSPRLDSESLVWEHRGTDEYSIREGDPLSATTTASFRDTLSRPGWAARMEVRSELTADAKQFHVTVAADAFEGDRRIHAKTWTFQIPRDCV